MKKLLCATLVLVAVLFQGCDNDNIETQSDTIFTQASVEGATLRFSIDDQIDLEAYIKINGDSNISSLTPYEDFNLTCEGIGVDECMYSMQILKRDDNETFIVDWDSTSEYSVAHCTLKRGELMTKQIIDRGDKIKIFLTTWNLDKNISVSTSKVFDINRT